MLILAMTTLAAMATGGASVLIVADEIPAMQALAEGMKGLKAVESRIVRQTEMPEELRAYDAVIVYIHGRLDQKPEEALLAYAEAGGKLILLHHSISSGKRSNARWFSSLGVELPEGHVESGGYKWIEGVSLEVCNLARHPITRDGVPYSVRVLFTDPRGRKTLRDGFALEHSEVYINHKLNGRRTTLLGFRYMDAASGRTWTQPTAGWLKRLGKGWVVYFMPGHTADEFRHPAYLRIITNAVMWTP